MKILRPSRFSSLLLALALALPAAPQARSPANGRPADAQAAIGESGATALTAAPRQCEVAIPSSGFPGDCVVVTFARTPETPADAAISGGSVRLLAPSGKTASRAAAFTARGSGGTGNASAVIAAGAAGSTAGAVGSTAGAATSMAGAATSMAGAATSMAGAATSMAGAPSAAGNPHAPSLTAIVAIPSSLKIGSYTIEAICSVTGGSGTATFTVAVPFEVAERKFPEETVRLDGANTAIKQNAGPERLAQIDRFNELLRYVDDKAPRFFGPFAPPVSATRRTSEYAYKRTYRYSNGKTEENVHTGIDFGVPENTPVFASGAGVVVMAESRISTGWTIILEHAPGIYSLYYHLKSMTVKEGDPVKTGEFIALSGSTGLSTGPHLHWEFRVNGTPVSPDWFVGRTLF